MQAALGWLTSGSTIRINYADLQIYKRRIAFNKSWLLSHGSWGILSPTSATILDPDTAHSDLVQSDDGKSVKEGDTQQDILDIPERFNPCCCVLGCDGFLFRETLLGGEGHGCRRMGHGGSLQ